jgi:hypothetical protein
MSQNNAANPSEASPPDSPQSSTFNSNSYSAVASGGQNNPGPLDTRTDKSPSAQKSLMEQLEPFKYSKEFILSLFKTSDIPPDFEANPLVTNEEALEPISFMPLTDIEKQVSTPIHFWYLRDDIPLINHTILSLCFEVGL